MLLFVPLLYIIKKNKFQNCSVLPATIAKVFMSIAIRINYSKGRPFGKINSTLATHRNTRLHSFCSGSFRKTFVNAFGRLKSVTTNRIIREVLVCPRVNHLSETRNRKSDDSVFPVKKGRGQNKIVLKKANSLEQHFIGIIHAN